LTVQSLVAMGLGTSKRGEFAAPMPKDYSAG
jgi:allantoin racemase